MPAGHRLFQRRFFLISLSQYNEMLGRYLIVATTDSVQILSSSSYYLSLGATNAVIPNKPRKVVDAYWQIRILMMLTIKRSLVNVVG
jgi:hypothetical protein